MRKTEILWILIAAGLAIAYMRRASSSPHAAGKCQGNTVPGYWADVL